MILVFFFFFVFSNFRNRDAGVSILQSEEALSRVFSGNFLGSGLCAFFE